MLLSCNALPYKIESLPEMQKQKIQIQKIQIPSWAHYLTISLISIDGNTLALSEPRPWIWWRYPIWFRERTICWKLGLVHCRNLCFLASSWLHELDGIRERRYISIFETKSPELLEFDFEWLRFITHMPVFKSPLFLEPKDCFLTVVFTVLSGSKRN